MKEKVSSPGRTTTLQVDRAGGELNNTTATTTTTTADSSTATDYVLGGSQEESRRLHRQFRLLLPDLDPYWTALLHRWGLADLIRRQRHQTGRLSLIVDAGCGPGLHLGRIAYHLQKRGLLDACYLLGVDNHEGRLSTAADYAASVGKNYLHFAPHDLTEPLSRLEEQLPDQVNSRPVLVYANHVLMHLFQAQRHLKELYDHLAPGGYLYLVDSVSYEGGEYGYQITGRMSPLLERFYRILWQPIRALNADGDVGEYSHQWLSEWGAEILEFNPMAKQAGGKTDQGQEVMANFAQIIQNSYEYYVKETGLLEENEYQRLKTETKLLSTAVRCTFVVFYTVARKPLL